MILLQIYRKIIPYNFRAFIKNSRFNFGKFILLCKITIFRKKNDLNAELQEVFDYTINNGLSIFPYDFKSYYKLENIIVYYDNDNKMHYVLHGNKKLYFKKSWNELQVKQYYNSLLIEQDKKSPHLYLTPDFNIEDNSIVFDLGVAEGIFSLSIINKVSHLYLFEPDQEWIEALNMTFLPWIDKVSIINKYVSDFNDSKNISINQFWNRNEVIDFIKIDVDGFERKVLNGMDVLLSSNKINRIALCTYHENNDEVEFKTFLEKYKFIIKYSQGYMLFYNHGTNLKPPYFRRGLLRASNPNL